MSSLNVALERGLPVASVGAVVASEGLLSGVDHVMLSKVPFVVKLLETHGTHVLHPRV